MTIWDFTKKAILKVINVHWKLWEKIYMKSVRTRIRNKDFSIICSNCIGGTIYHLLGLRFNSPTINLWIDKREFIMFAVNLKYYLDQELHFYEKKGRTCPCAYLGDGEKRISIDFVHYKTEDEARNKWEERKQRINWDNLYIITCDDDKVLDNEFLPLNTVKCKRKIIFTAIDRPNIEDSFTLYCMKKKTNAATMTADRTWFRGFRPWQREFNLTAWLNDEENIRI